MLVLKNIKREGNIMSADYYPEDEQDYGHIEIDFTTGEIVSLQKPQLYMYFTDASHARRELMRLSKVEKLPERKVVLWY